MLQVEFTCMSTILVLTAERSESSAGVPSLHVHVCELYLLEVQGSLEVYGMDRSGMHCMLHLA